MEKFSRGHLPAPFFVEPAISAEDVNPRTNGQRHQPLSSTQLLLSGAISGSLAKTAIAPMDRLKILFQTNSKDNFTLRGVVLKSKSIYNSTGLSSFWKGHTATLMRIVPYSATNFYVFDRTRHILDDMMGGHTHPIVIKFSAGAVSGTSAVCVTYPLETLRARLAVDVDGPAYRKGYINAVRTIASSSGLLSLYSGLKPTLVGIIPYAGTSFAVYETLKTEKMTFGERFATGAIAGIVAQASTYPLDVVRRRMQVDPVTYPSMSATLARVLRGEGFIRGLYKGLSMNLIKGPIAVAISLNANDHIKKFFQNKL
jgi:solute carrier family 25 protein 42